MFYRPYYTIILIILYLLIAEGEISGQLSPGDLTKAHAHLEGLKNCTSCHVIGEQVYNSKCLNCHTEIQKTIDSGTGYHSSSDVKGKNCWSCHSEHHGRNFRIINFIPEKFNHSKTAFELTGKHIKTDCRGCHQPKFIKDPELRKKNNTWLGLKMECSSCHEDSHKGKLGDNCATCHTTNNFAPAEKFNHNDAAFKLTGAHIKTDCISCHPKEKIDGKQIQRFKGISFESCSNCHKDAHEGKFGRNCESCHSTTSFRQINRSNIDHSKTGFPLIGKHKEVNCSGCHKNSLTKKLNYRNCFDCHKDYHKGELTINKSIRDCRECHNEFGFTPSLFSIEEHKKSKFPLMGAHLAIPCQSCHYKNNDWKFRLANIECSGCHNNPHGSEISEKYLNNSCSSCHQTINWNTIYFDHNKTEFKLIGRHKEISCGSCHITGAGEERIHRFNSLTGNCTECHKDIHFEQFTEGEKANCERCHTFNNWEPELFTHSQTGFKLEGAHSKIECSRCHRTIEEGGNKYIQYKIRDFKCATCHS
jgi:hypothetical protein